MDSLDIKLIKQVADGKQRLHIIITGSDNNMTKGIEALISSLAGTSVPIDIVDEFKDIPTMSIEEEKALLSEINKEEELVEKNEFLDLLRAKNERGFYDTWKTRNSMNPREQQDFDAALKIWFVERFSTDPYGTEEAGMKLHRGFFTVFKDLIPTEIDALETSLGLASGTFIKGASDEQIMECYPLVVDSMMKRITK